MPRRPSLSWQMKVAIWDLAAKLGANEHTAIQRSLERVAREQQLDEDVPGTRTIKSVVEELQSMAPAALRTLPEHVRLLREDCAGAESGETGVGRGGQDRPQNAVAAPPGQWSKLLPALLDLKGIDVFPVNHEDLAVWRSRPKEPCWPMAKGQVCRGEGGELRIALHIEESLDWEYLRQHRPVDAVWKAIDAWKQAMAADLSARLRLLDRVVEQIERPASRGGLGLPVAPEISYGPQAQPCVSARCAFAVHRQALAQALGLPHAPLREGSFTEDGAYPHTTQLGGDRAIYSEDPEERREAAAFLLKAQGDSADWPEAAEAAVAYRKAEGAARQVKRELRRLELE